MTHRAGTSLLYGEVLAAVPMRNRAVRSETQARGAVLWLPLEQRWWARLPWRLFLPVRREKGFELDDLGREIWRACDDLATVEQIVEAFACRHHLTFHEARLPVVTFLESLVARRLIVLRMASIVRSPGENAA